MVSEFIFKKRLRYSLDMSSAPKAISQTSEKPSFFREETNCPGFISSKAEAKEGARQAITFLLSDKSFSTLGIWDSTSFAPWAQTLIQLPHWMHLSAIT